MSARVLVAAGLMLALAPAAALGHGSAADHLAEDSVHDAAAEPLMEAHTRTVTAVDARAAVRSPPPLPATSTSSGSGGRWSTGPRSASTSR
jgi:hypothetical protein